MNKSEFHKPILIKKIPKRDNRVGDGRPCFNAYSSCHRNMQGGNYGAKAWT